MRRECERVPVARLNSEVRVHDACTARQALSGTSSSSSKRPFSSCPDIASVPSNAIPW